MSSGSLSFSGDPGDYISGGQSYSYSTGAGDVLNISSDSAHSMVSVSVDPSVGTVGDALNNALAESVIGLFKTELIRRRGPWRTVEHVEAAALDWIAWFNHHRLLEVNGDLPPIELEQAHYRQAPGLTEAG